MNYRDILIHASRSLHDAMALVDRTGHQICLVIDDDQRLLGLLTDGDIRRAILAGKGLEAPARSAMNPRPVTAPAHWGRSRHLNLMGKHRISHLPLLDDAGKIVDLLVWGKTWEKPFYEARENAVLLMAGGFGSRLKDLTKNTPKPLLAVGNKPILEIILENFISYNFRRFYISVHYRSDMIMSHFGDGGRWNAEISYLREERSLGTAGALGLLPERPTAPLLMMNGDLLSAVNFDALLARHVSTQAVATMCARPHEIQVPFGVIRTDSTGETLTAIEEKPKISLKTNAGIYVLSPEAVDCVQPGEAIDIPALFTRMVEKKLKVSIFDLQGEWIDIGRLEDLQRARSLFGDEARL